MKRADAYAKLVEHCDALSEVYVGGEDRRLNAKTRRLIRALLVEREAEAQAKLDRHYYDGHGASAKHLLGAAVLRRPATRRGK